MNVTLPTRRLTVDEFLAWAVRQTEGNPVIVVEVLSPSTARTDATTKRKGYFGVASVRHYLIIDPESRTITHHKRGRGADVKTRVVRRGVLALNPPGIEVRLVDVFGLARP